MSVVSAQPSKVHLISLGCARNLVDSEVMLGGLLDDGWQMTTQPDEADAIVVNTCGFISSAKQESIDTILEAAEHKKVNPALKLVVTGCLTQRYKGQLAKGLPEVDLFVGTDEFPQIASYMRDLEHKDAESPRVRARRTHYIYDEATARVNTLAKHAAYVKVAEGCQHQCAFCIIPAIRGTLRSRPIASVVEEVEKLVASGVIEVNLIAQDLAAYGRESGEDRLLPLLRALAAIDGLRWIRLLYMYPENISDEFLDFFASEPKLCKYLDIPMQHGSDAVLARMNRQVTRRQLEESVARVRQAVPDVSIRTTVMAGFPGETEEEFADLLSFVREQKFDHLGCFAYSQEEGTVAGRMKDQVPDEVKQQRVDQVMAVQQQVSRDLLTRFVGTTQSVLVSGVSEESDYLWEGRLSTQAPEADGVVLLNDGSPKPGSIQSVKITSSLDYDLIGEVIS